MAVTQYQQFLADKAQVASDPEECCLSMGGDLVTDSDGTSLCSFTDYEYPLSLACTYAQQVAENAPDANQQQSGGGIGAWLSQNLETLVGIGQQVGTLLGGTPPPPPELTETEEDNNTGTIIAVAVAIFVVVVAIVLIRKKAK